MTPPPERLLLTGATGFVGRVLRARLEASDQFALLCPTHAALDLSDRDAVRRYLGAHRPALLVHLAAATAGAAVMRSNPLRYFDANLDGARALVEAAGAGAFRRVVVPGSAAEYDPTIGAQASPPRGLHPDDLWRGVPTGGYGLAKRVISHLFLQARAEAAWGGHAPADVFTLVWPTVYGPGDGGDGHVDPARSRAIPGIARRILDALCSHAPSVEIPGSGFEVRDFLHVDDAAASVEAALRAPCPPGGVLRAHVSDGRAHRLDAVAARIAKACGYTGEIVWRARGEGATASSDAYWLEPDGLDILGFTPETSLDAGLHHVVADVMRRG